jgi:hypothetical protein
MNPDRYGRSEKPLMPGDLLFVFSFLSVFICVYLWFHKSSFS